MHYYIAIVDDSDVRHLIKLINVVGGRPMNVYVLVDEADGAKEGDDRWKTYGSNISSGKGRNNLIGTFITPRVPQFHSVAKNKNMVHSSIHYKDP